MARSLAAFLKQLPDDDASYAPGLTVDGAKVIARRRSLGLDFRFATKRQVFDELMRRFVERQGRFAARRGTQASSRRPGGARNSASLPRGNEAFVQARNESQ